MGEEGEDGRKETERRFDLRGDPPLGVEGADGVEKGLGQDTNQVNDPTSQRNSLGRSQITLTGDRRVQSPDVSGQTLLQDVTTFTRYDTR